MPTNPDSTWGLCMNCQWWQIEPKAAIAEETVGLCIEENLQPYRLSITEKEVVSSPHNPRCLYTALAPAFRFPRRQ